MMGATTGRMSQTNPDLQAYHISALFRKKGKCLGTRSPGKRGKSSLTIFVSLTGPAKCPN